MKTELVINNVDVRPFVAEDGISYSKGARVQRSVVTIGGTEFRTEIPVYPMSVTLLPMNDEALGIVLGALSTSPASVTYIDRFTKTRKTNQLFYVDDISFTEGYIAGTSTEMTSVSFGLTPRG